MVTEEGHLTDILNEVERLREALRDLVDHVTGELFARGQGNVEEADDDPVVDRARALLPETEEDK